MAECNYLTTNEDLNETLTELEKLHLANKYANQLLERDGNHFSHLTSLESKDDNLEGKNINQQPTSPTDFLSDHWGANRYLNAKKFDFVKDYLQRTDKLLEKNNQLKTVTAASTYEVVESTTDLFTKVEHNHVGAQTVTDITKAHEEKSSQVNGKELVSMSEIDGETFNDREQLSSLFNVKETEFMSETNSEKRSNFVSKEDLVFNPALVEDKTTFHATDKDVLQVPQEDEMLQIVSNEKKNVIVLSPAPLEEKSTSSFAIQSDTLQKADHDYTEGGKLENCVNVNETATIIDTPDSQTFNGGIQYDVDLLDVSSIESSLSCDTDEISVTFNSQENNVQDTVILSKTDKQCSSFPQNNVNYDHELEEAKDCILETHRPLEDTQQFVKVFSTSATLEDYPKALPASCWFTPEQSFNKESPKKDEKVNESLADTQRHGSMFHDCEQCRSHPHSNYLTSDSIIPPASFSQLLHNKEPTSKGAEKPKETFLNNLQNINSSSLIAVTENILPVVGNVMTVADFANEKLVNLPELTQSSLPTSSSSPLLSLLMQSNTSTDLAGSGDFNGNSNQQPCIIETTNKPLTLSTENVENASVTKTGQKRDENNSVPKLNLKAVVGQSTTKSRGKPKDKLPVRPRSAGFLKSPSKINAQRTENNKTVNVAEDSKQKTEQSPIQLNQRPKSASKVMDIKRSVSPQRVWEKSSIAWSSYGHRELNTWSSMSISPKRKVASPKKVVSLAPNIESSVAKSPRVWIEQNLRPVNFCQNLKDFPDEIILDIFSYLPFPQLTIVAKVCQRFNTLANDFMLWQNVQGNDVKISDAWLSSIGERQPKSIEMTNCCGKTVTNRGLRNFFRNCKTRLESLHVSKCTGSQLAGDSVLLHAACYCRCLTKVCVPWTSTTDNGFSAICTALKTITDVNINGNSSITDESFTILSKRHSKTVQSLEMSGCFSVSCTVLSGLLNQTTNLHKLNIGLCSKVSVDFMLLWCKKLTHLQHLDLHGIKSINNDCLHEIAKNCTQLTTLILANCPSITDVGLSSISKHLPAMLHLSLAGCPKITDNGIADFILAATLLKHLDVSSTSATKLTVDMISNYRHEQIETLKVSFCKNITQSCLLSLLETCASLRSLHVYGCKRINLHALIKTNRNVVIEK